MAARLPVGVAGKKKAPSGFEASGCVSADEMRSRVLRRRYPYNIAVIGPSQSGKATVIKAIAKCMGSGVPEENVPTKTESGLETTVVYSRHMAICLIKTPGDPARRREVITALAQADAVLLVVSSKPDEWKASSDAQEWQEYIKLVRGMDRDGALITVINKIDETDGRPQDTLSRFMRCKMPMHRYMEKILRGAKSNPKSRGANPCKFAKNRMLCVSGQTGLGISTAWGANGPSNLNKHMQLLGGTLQRFLNGFGETGYALNKGVREGFIKGLRSKGLRVLIDDVYYGDSGWVAVGKVLTGALRVGQEVNIAPGGVLTTCKSIKHTNADTGAPNFNPKIAVAGQRVEITIGEKGLSANMIFRGSVMGNAVAGSDAPETVSEFTATVYILNDAKFNISVKSIAVGSMFRGEETTEQPFDFWGDAHPAYFDKLLAIINPKTGRTIKEKPENVEPGQTARCVVRLSGEGIPLDLYEQYKDTGRFLVRDENGQGRLVAVGRVTGKDWL